MSSIEEHLSDLEAKFDLKYCPKCREGRRFGPEEEYFCTECSTPLIGFPLEPILCSKCKTEVETFDNFCPRCGTRLEKVVKDGG